MPNPPHIAEQYRALRREGGIFIRNDRGLIEAMGILVHKRDRTNEQKCDALSSTPWLEARFCGLILFCALGDWHRPTTAILSESKRDQANQSTIAREARAQPRGSHLQEWSRDRSG